jgi:hypothetical protein
LSLIEYKGFGGVRLAADMLGDENDPAVLLVPGIGQDRAAWREVADALVLSGRRVVNLGLRDEQPLAPHVEDLRLVLAQMGSRPVVVAAADGGWVAARALALDGAHLAAGLVVVDMPVDEGAIADGLAARVAVPTLVIRGGFSPAQSSAVGDAFNVALPMGESADIDDCDLALASDRKEALLGQLLEFLERHQPREAMEFKAGSDPRTLRDAMGCFATGITIVTALDATGTPVGLTANSFTSVSLDPPLLLVCIANTAGTAPILRDAAHFGVNVLQIGQQPTSNRFAAKGPPWSN